MTANDKLNMFDDALNAWMNNEALKNLRNDEKAEMIADLRNDWNELKDCNDAASIDARRIIERELELLGGMGAMTVSGMVVFNY